MKGTRGPIKEGSKMDRKRDSGQKKLKHPVNQTMFLWGTLLRILPIGLKTPIAP